MVGAPAWRRRALVARLSAMSTYDPGELLTPLTTEHFTLQGARSQTISETSARASVYMLSVSSALVAAATGIHPLSPTPGTIA
jgi:hypothetical protein